MIQYLQVKDRAKQILWLIGGVALCIYILNPLFSALLGRLCLFVSVRHFLLIDVFVEAFAIGLAAFIMGAIISWSWANSEMKGALFGCILAAGLFVIQKVRFVVAAPEPYNKLWALEILMGIILLFAFGFWAALLVQNKQRP